MRSGGRERPSRHHQQRGCPDGRGRRHGDDPLAMRSPYQFVGGTLAATGEGYAFEVGFTNAKDWRKTDYTPLATLAEFDGQFQGRTGTTLEYWLKCTLTGQASLSGVNIRNDVQMAPLAMPSMTVGDNRFTYLEHPNQRSGHSAARHLRITHRWVERSRTRPPKRPTLPSTRPTVDSATARTWCSSGTRPWIPTAMRSQTTISSSRTVPTSAGPCRPTSRSTFPRRRTKAMPATRCRGPAS